ncbi:hypothetical protein PG996_010118 [Apiospora saccharicola]|uniref:Uncharacterized protein n=1 Tax=Apiospora saccharicola TaxID=335842 RepID=A0ABR1UMP5_9PEZI
MPPDTSSFVSSKKNEGDVQTVWMQAYNAGYGPHDAVSFNVYAGSSGRVEGGRSRVQRHIYEASCLNPPHITSQHVDFTREPKRVMDFQVVNIVPNSSKGSPNTAGALYDDPEFVNFVEGLINLFLGLSLHVEEIRSHPKPVQDHQVAIRAGLSLPNLQHKSLNQEWSIWKTAPYIFSEEVIVCDRCSRLLADVTLRSHPDRAGIWVCEDCYVYIDTNRRVPDPIEQASRERGLLLTSKEELGRHSSIDRICSLCNCSPKDDRDLKKDSQWKHITLQLQPDQMICKICWMQLQEQKAPRWISWSFADVEVLPCSSCGCVGFKNWYQGDNKQPPQCF